MRLTSEPAGAFTQEFQLACHCCKAKHTGEDLDVIARLIHEVDVSAFAELALNRHRIGPLVYATLKRLPASKVPAELLRPLAAATRENAIRVLRAQRALMLLSRWFAEAGIPWMAFKGLTVAGCFYEDVTHRHVNDLDIWVPESELQRARLLLKGHGFSIDVSSGYWDLARRGPRHQRYLMHYFHEEQHFSKEFGVLELHWRLTDTPSRFNLSPTQMLEQASQFEWGKLSVPVMNDLDLLLYLCEHGGRHGWCRLKWLADLPRLLYQREWDWQQTLTRARQIGSARTLLLGLALCEELLGWEAPEVVRSEVRRLSFLPVVLDIVRRTLLAPIGFHEAHEKVSLIWLVRDSSRQLLLSSSFNALGTQLWRRALSFNDMRSVSLPDRWFNLYYLLRPVLAVVRRLRP